MIYSFSPFGYDGSIISVEVDLRHGIPSTDIVGLADGSVKEVRGFDSVVLAMGSRNYDPISESIKGIVKETYVIGDAVRARRALNATAEALDVALSI